jgi:hypothetical protein
MRKAIIRISSSTAILLLFFIVLIPIFNINATARDPIYNARSVISVDWSLSETQVPIIPRDEIRELKLTVEYRVDMGESVGEGIFEQYESKPVNAVIKLEIIETPSWCYAVLGSTTVATNISIRETTFTKIYVTIDESAPAYSKEGIIKIKANVGNLGLIEGEEKVFNLKFKPAYLPIINPKFPEINTKRISAEKNAIFPIEIENMGNSRTKVILKVEHVSKNWQATVTDEVILEQGKGSTAIAYVTVIPPKDIGYHYGQGSVKVSMTPYRAENLEEVGNPSYATFIVQSRGFSSRGIENIFLIFIFIAIAIVVIFIIVRKRRN